MDGISLALGVFVGLALGGAVCFFYLRGRFLEKEVHQKSENAELRTRLELTEKMAKESEAKLPDSFRALSAQALQTNNQSFLDLAKTSLEGYQNKAKSEMDTLFVPMKEALEKVDRRISDLEKARVGAYEVLKQQVFDLKSETANLSKALRSPVARGRWGEIQLKRVCEMAGMLDHCDFYEQESVTTESGRLRPDLVVRLPGGKSIVVDSKVPLSSYLESLEAQDDETRVQKMKAHAQQIRNHMNQLSRKGYWDQFQPAPEFVVLFLPGETFFGAALEHDPGLIEAGVDQKVILATPTTLIALLRAVAYGWQQESLAKNAKQISDLGKDLYKRLADMGGHIGKLGKSLGQAVDSYNRTVGSLETRVMVSARKFKELEASSPSAEIPDLPPLDGVPRNLRDDLGGSLKGELQGPEGNA